MTTTATSTTTAAASNTDGFEFFQGHISQSSSKPQITVRRGGLMVFTVAAVEMLGDDPPPLPCSTGREGLFC